VEKARESSHSEPKETLEQAAKAAALCLVADALRRIRHATMVDKVTQKNLL